MSPITRIAGSLAVAAALTGVPVRSQIVDTSLEKIETIEGQSENTENSLSNDGPVPIDVEPALPSPPSNPEVSTETSQPSTAKPPEEIDLKADRQSFDARRGVFIAEGNVQAQLRGGILQADRVEFDSNFNTLFARGSVRLRRGSQYFQASSFRYSLIQNSGELEDVYGVLELDELSEGFGPSSTVASSSSSSNPEQLLPVMESTGLGFPTAIDLELGSTTPERVNTQGPVGNFWDEAILPLNTWTVPSTGEKSQNDKKLADGMACPAPLPPIPDWHPHPWAVTVWAGR